MALGEIPPWLNVQPSDYLRAVQAGGAAGLGIAEAQNRAREAANRLAAAQQEQAARMQDAQRAAAQREWEFGERMRQAAEENASGNALKQQQLEQQGRYQEGMLGYHQRQQGELSAHNQAMESISADKAERLLEAGQAQIVEHAEAPGLKFLRNPSGSESVIERPNKDLSEGQLLDYSMRAYNMMKPGASELGNEPSYQARTNYAGEVLRKLQDRKPSPSEGSLMPISPIGDEVYPKET